MAKGTCTSARIFLYTVEILAPPHAVFWMYFPKAYQVRNHKAL